uniref:TIR domain n=1 Tax=Candidatus Kentrum eta TaxID=2126337 RepID=A0A450UR28_9GAMM|nr:MAG: TIR domain [Candidatus Kentron sp. H]VFJ88751.1 MAG: TIR domain [Candidatus Kentron sp. H]VFJ95012.1 MAG: TIR domain [Candidatus Kentron sp. H]
MPLFATFDDLRRFNREMGSRVRATLDSASYTKSGKTVFLSHSSADKEYLPAVITILENHGGRVYIDSEDDRLPNSPDRETAEILRGTIKSCRRFVLLVTTNANGCLGNWDWRMERRASGRSPCFRRQRNHTSRNGQRRNI